MKISIFYFSGTGNTLKIAKDLDKTFDQCEMIPIVKSWRKKSFNIDTECVGLLFPLYYLGLPHIVKEFVKQLKVSSNTYIFTVITFYRSFRGDAIHKLKKILGKANLNLSAGFYIRMPTNFIAHYDVPLLKEQENLFYKASEKIKQIHKHIIDKHMKFDREPYFLLSPFIRPLLRYKFQDVRYFWADSKCNGCGICKKICLNNNISIIDEKPYWDNHCIDCFSCINFCPKEAIQYKKKTAKRGRYHHPDIKIKDIMLQKD